MPDCCWIAYRRPPAQRKRNKECYRQGSPCHIMFWVVRHGLMEGGGGILPVLLYGFNYKFLYHYNNHIFVSYCNVNLEITIGEFKLDI